jgi:uncharacterized protein
MRFLCDEMFGKLAKYLRLLGFDAAYAKTKGARHYLLARDPDRILLTGRTRVTETEKYLRLRSTTAREQLLELREFIGPAIDRSAIFGRCIECNVELSPVEKSDIESLVAEFVYHHYSHFKQCPTCRRVYWEGSHTEGMGKLIQEILG